MASVAGQRAARGTEEAEWVRQLNPLRDVAPGFDADAVARPAGGLSVSFARVAYWATRAKETDRPPGETGTGAVHLAVKQSSTRLWRPPG